MIEVVAVALPAAGMDVGVVDEVGVASGDLLSRQATVVRNNSRTKRAEGRSTLEFYRRGNPALVARSVVVGWKSCVVTKSRCGA